MIHVYIFAVVKRVLSLFFFSLNEETRTFDIYIYNESYLALKNVLFRLYPGVRRTLHDNVSYLAALITTLSANPDRRFR